MHDSESPYHAGEISVQERTGERATAERHARLIQPVIPEQARAFLAEQSMLVLAAGGPSGDVWVSVWFGARGFAQSCDEGRIVQIDRQRVVPLEVDPVLELLAPGSAVGILAIELETRRRLRVNGSLQSDGAGDLRIAVTESFPSCPKYITKRRLEIRSPGVSGEPAARVSQGDRLDAARIETIGRTDTVFVGSRHPERGADASHRGGDPGFVRVVDDRRLRVPDYEGNGMYQTLGNLHAQGSVGLTFLDFDACRVLHVTGVAEIRFEEHDATLPTGGTHRSWDVRIHRWLEAALPIAVRATFVERSRWVPRS